MLPDLPVLKHELQSIFNKYLRRQIDARLGVFNESPKHLIHEGRELHTTRADGSSSNTNLKLSSTEMTLKLEEIPTLSIEERTKKLDLLADDMAKQISENLFNSLHADLESAGQVVDRKGKALDAEAIFELLEKITIDFDEPEGSHNTSIVISPEMAVSFQLIFNQIESDPMLLKKHNEIMNKKRMEWRDREAARKLVG